MRLPSPLSSLALAAALTETGDGAETSDVLGALRSQQGLDERSRHRALQGELVGLLKGRKPVAA